MIEKEKSHQVFTSLTRCLLSPALMMEQAEIASVVQGCCWKHCSQSRWTCASYACLSHQKQVLVRAR